MQSSSNKQRFPSQPESSNANVTSAIGMAEPAGYRRARKNSIFTQTVMWFTGLVCTAFLLGSLAQAWSNSQLAQKVQDAQQQLHGVQQKHDQLAQAAQRYKDPAVIESEARQKLGYIRPGEHPVVIVGPNTSNRQTGQQGSKVTTPQNFWRDWWQTFFSD